MYMIDCFMSLVFCGMWFITYSDLAENWSPVRIK